MIDDISSKPLEEQVYRALEEEILSGALKPGDMLAEIPVAKRLGVSRTPVRSALGRLADDGLVEITPRKGASVVGINRDDLISTYKIRIRLEGLATAMAAERMTEEELDRLQALVDLADYYAEKGDAEKLKDMDTEFHELIYRSSGSRMLAKILGELHRNVRAYRKQSLKTPGRSESSRAEHRLILEALRRGDAMQAEALTVRHVEKAMDNIVEGFTVLEK